MLCRVSRTVRQSFCPTLAADCLPKIQRLAVAKEVKGLSLHGRVVGFSTPALCDIGGASVRIRLEEQGTDNRVSLREGSYLLALRASTPGAYLPAIAGVPCRQGLDRYGESRVGLAECMVMARPLADEGHLTFLHEPVLRAWLAEHVEVVVLARVTDFFLGLNAGTWLRIRISDIAAACRRWLDSLADAGDCEVPRFLKAAGLELVDEVEAPPSDNLELWHYWGGGGNTGVSGQLTKPNELPQEATKIFHFRQRELSVEVGERLSSGLDVDLTGDRVWPTAVAFCRYLCETGQLRGRRVLDLSAGLGLVGLVASRLGAEVTLTDVPRVMPLLRRNVALATIPDLTMTAAEPGDLPQVRELMWGEEPAKQFVDQEGSFDLILCCEVVYQQPQEVWEALQQTLRHLLRPGGQAIFAYQHRDGAEVTDAHFFATLGAAAKLSLQREESLSPWDDLWDDADLRFVRTYVAQNESSL